MIRADTKNDYEYLLQKRHELADYKSRCEKAIELLELKQLRYLNEDNYRLCTLDLQEVKDILQNGSEINENLCSRR